jgi:hypothetical protein
MNIAEKNVREVAKKGEEERERHRERYMSS